ncbi:MAG TPA: LPS assembly lipoprotein LptE [Xanthobacteraceae bacterium]|jgi:LPS-assembly lipoprotein
MRIAARLAVVTMLAGLLAGCFRPMYAERSADGGSALREKLLGVEVPPLDIPNGSRMARIGVEVRNALAFKMYGNATGMPPTHRLILRLTSSNATVMTDSVSQLPSVESYTLNASFNLVEIATGKSVMNGTSFSTVSYDNPGSNFQRFNRTRAFRDAEDRASQEIADNIQTRLASFFYSGT